MQQTMKGRNSSDEQVVEVQKNVGGRSEDGRSVPPARDLADAVLQLEGRVRREDRVGRAAPEDLETKVKQLLAEAELDKAALKDVLGRKW